MTDKSYSYFGLQNGTSCYCGKDHGKYGKLSDEACNITCNGNEAEKCGGTEANNVFFYGLGKLCFCFERKFVKSLLIIVSNFIKRKKSSKSQY